MQDRQARTVLIIDSDERSLAGLAILLRRLGYGVMTAKNASAALLVLEQKAPSLLLIEIALPGPRGIELLQQMRSMEALRSVPVVVLSQKEDPQIRAEYLGMGCMAYLLKPVDPNHLYRIIQASTEPVPRARIRINTTLRASVGDGGALKTGDHAAVATMLSEGGCFLRTLSPRPKDTQVPIRLFVRDREIQANASVLYTAVLQAGPFREPGMGLKFIDIAPRDRKYLRDFIVEQLTSDLRQDA